MAAETHTAALPSWDEMERELEKLRAALRKIIAMDEECGPGFDDGAAGYSAGLADCADIAREALS